MNRYHFNAAGGDKQLGYTAEVWANSGDEAVTVLDAFFAGNNTEIKTSDKCFDHDDDTPHVHWLNAYNNDRPVVSGDIDEAEDEDGNEICVFCGRGDAPHTSDCPDALAQDLESGEIGPEDDSYSDALEAYGMIHGHPFRQPGEVTNKQRAGWAQAAIDAFRGATRTDEEDALADLLCNLLHLYGEERFEGDLRRARGLHAEELHEDPAA